MSGFIRQFHRWIAIVFMIAVIVNLIAAAMRQQEVWIGLLALAPLILLMLSGLYLFFLPYAARAQRKDVT